MATKFSNLMIEETNASYHLESKSNADLGEFFAQPRAMLTNLSQEQLGRYGLMLIDAPQSISHPVYANIHQMIPAEWRESPWLVKRPDRGKPAHASKKDWIEKFSSRLSDLQAIATEEGIKLCRASFDTGLSFVSSLATASLPSAFLIANGNLRILWLNAKQEQIGIQFLSNGDAQYILFKWRNERLVHMMGTDAVSSVLEVIAAMGLTHVMHA
jgi:hypothetical protein